SAGSAGTHRLANEAATESAILIAVFSGFQAGSPKSRPHLYATIARNTVYTDISGESFAAPQTQDSPVHECCTPFRAAISAGADLEVCVRACTTHRGINTVRRVLTLALGRPTAAAPDHRQ